MGAVVDRASAPHILDRSECVALLATGRLGRIAMSDQALPIVLPVMYRVGTDSIEFEANGRLLSAAAHGGHVVCFEADSADFETGAGWSVIVIGKLEVAAPGLVLGRGPWMAGGRGTTMRLPLDIVSGRAVGTPGPLSSLLGSDAGLRSDGPTKPAVTAPR